MNREDFMKLQRGDIVRHVSGANSYVIIDDNRKDPIGIRSVTLTNPDEWDKIPIAALEDKCEWCDRITRETFNTICAVYDEQINAAEEALKAMEREQTILAEIIEDFGKQLSLEDQLRSERDITRKTLEIANKNYQDLQDYLAASSMWSAKYFDETMKLRSELAASRETVQQGLDSENNLRSYVKELETKVATASDLQATVRELLEWIPLVGSIDVKPLFAKIHDLFPDPDGTKMWEWALEELKSGRKVRWKDWKGMWLLKKQSFPQELQLWDADGLKAYFVASDPAYFTKPGWLPYMEKK